LKGRDVGHSRPWPNERDIIAWSGDGWEVTVHAVRRYIERVARVDPERAMREIVGQLRSAHRVKTRANGWECWRGPKPRRVRFFVDAGEQRRVVTIVGAFDGMRARCR
jgi:hypothetical protein